MTMTYINWGAFAPDAWLLVPLIIICIVLVLSLYHYYKRFKAAELLLEKDIDTTTARYVVLQGVHKSLKIWNLLAFFLHTLYVLFGIVAITASVYVTTYVSAFKAEKSHTEIPIVSFIATLSITLITAFNLGEKANAFRRAWRELEMGLNQHLTDAKTLDDLIKTKLDCEVIVGGVDFQYSPK
jgi:amino acid transporter